MENGIEEPITVDEPDAVETSMQVELKNSLRCLNFKCTIYRVPEFIRKESRDCYRPLVISIGPVFYKDPQLETMQQLKWIYLESFLKHGKGSLEHYINIVREMNDEIRECYEEESMLRCDGDEFVKMIVLDAIFLLHLFLGLANLLPIPKKLRTLLAFIARDIFLSENQIPFFVLKRLYDETFVEPSGRSLILIIKEYIHCCKGIPGSEDTTIMEMGDVSKDIAHLVDFLWKHCRSSFEMHKREQQEHAVAITKKGANISAVLWNKCCYSFFNTQPGDHEPAQAPQLPEMTAKQLSDSGVKFMVSESQSPLCITFNKTNGELHVPKLYIFDEFETILRNILFFEQSHYYCKDGSCFIDLIVFFNRLINNVKDVHILQQVGILDNNIAGDEALFDLFKNVDKNIGYTHPFIYSNVCQELNTYANKPWNRWKAILRRDYFNHPWAIISFIFAIILFALTVIQTITGFTNK